MKGQTLLEGLVAFALIAVVMSAITSLVVNSLGNTERSKTQNLGTQYTQEGIEIIHKIRNSNYATFADSNGLYCLAKDSVVLVPGPCTAPNIDSSFIREVLVENNSSPNKCAVDISRVTVTVSWSDGRCMGGTYCNKSQNSTCISTVNPIQF